MTKVFFPFFLVLFSLQLAAQPAISKDSVNTELFTTTDNFFFEIGGSFVWLGGLNYERIVFRKKHFFATLRGGVGLDLWHSAQSALALLAGGSLNFGKVHYLEIGANAKWSIWVERIRPSLDAPVTYDWNASINYLPHIGYRYQPLATNFIFRLTVVPLRLPCGLNSTVCNNLWVPWIGISGGISF